MEFHTFGTPGDPAIVFIHGVFTPWQIWEKHAGAFTDDHYVVVPALDAHIEEHPSEFVSTDDEAQKIEEYIKDHLDCRAFALCGLSMGGVIAYRIFERGSIAIDNLVLDGAPLVKAGGFAQKMMTASYKSILRGSKSRSPKTIENFGKVFLPEKFLESYLRFADTMSEDSVANMIRSVCSCDIKAPVSGADTRLLYLHGTKGNEVYSVKTAKRLSRLYPQAVIRRFEGLAHCELAVYRSDEWIKEVKEFLDNAV